jgi:hypothetical protein
MRHIVIDQKSNEHPQPAVAMVQTNNPTPISLKGLCLQGRETFVKWEGKGTPKDWGH